MSRTVESVNFALRPVLGSVFDRHPKAKLILSHVGELLPFRFWRFEIRWKTCNVKVQTLKLAPSGFLKLGLWITTPGIRRDAPLCHRGAWQEPDHVFG